MEKLINWLILRSIKGVGNKSLKRLYDYFGSGKAILESDIHTLSMIVGKERAVRIKNREGYSERALERLLNLMDRWQINAVSIEDENYFPQLRFIEDPPPVLFYKGNIKFGTFVGIVGPRFPTIYTLKLVEDLCIELVRGGVFTVSGGARGVDTKVHETTVSEGGYTVWVAGTGLLNVDVALQKKVIEGGSAIISEFDPLERGGKYSFSVRNRIISAISDFVVIPEAGKKSGSLITAKYAIRQGKRIFVHIGMGRSDRWEGCYMLLKEGKAEIFKDPSEIMDLISPSVIVEEDREEKKSISEEDILSLLETPKTFDELLIETNMGREELMGILSLLEIEGKISRFGIYYMYNN